MNANYLQATGALLGASSNSTPSASSSTVTVDSMSPHGRGANGHAAPGPISYGLAPPEPVNPLPSTFLPSYYADRRTPDVPPSYHLSPGVDSGDAISGFTANIYGSPYLNNLPSRIPQRHLLDDVSLPPPPPRAAVPSFHSPSPQLDLPLPGNRWPPQGRTSWPDPAMFDWPRLSGAGEGSARNGSSESGEDGRQRGQSAARAHSESSPLSIPHSLHRNYSGPPTLTSPVGEYDYPKSATYPSNLYSDLVGESPSWGPGRDVSGTDCGQALAIYEHLFSSLPHIRPITSSSQIESTTSFQPLLDLSSEGVAVFASHHGPLQPYASELTASTNTNASTPTGSALLAGKRAGKDKAQTKCLGCGATETPEWRRGPMGPRTLCNACGLVHMKLQRKRKKQDEKLAAAKAQSEGLQVELPGAGKAKKVKRDEEG